MKRDKRKWTMPGIVIAVACALLIGYIVSLVLLFQNCSCRSEAIIGAIGGAISFIGTIFLGIISFWQTRTANDISQAQLRRELITYMMPKPEVEVRQGSFAIKAMLTLLPDLSLEGIFCSTDPLDEIGDAHRSFFEFTFQFQTEGAPLEKICPTDIKINRELAEDGEQYFADLKILNPKKSAVFVYNPTLSSYVLKIYINAPVDFLESISQNNLFILDITFDVVSIYGTVQENSWSINFENDEIPFKDLYNNVKDLEKLNIRNIIIRKGEPKYAK